MAVDQLTMWGTPSRPTMQGPAASGPRRRAVAPGGVATGPHGVYGQRPGQAVPTAPVATPYAGAGGDPLAVLTRLMAMYQQPAGAVARPGLPMPMRAPAPMGMGGEGGAMGGLGPAPAPVAPQNRVPAPARNQGVGQSNGGVSSGPAAPGPGGTPVGRPTGRPSTVSRFTPQDIAAVAASIDPDLAAIMGFGNLGSVTGTWGRNTDIFSHVGDRWNSEGGLPGDYNADDFRWFFTDPAQELQNLYETPGNPNLHRTEAVGFLNEVADMLALIEQGQLSLPGSTTGPGQPGPVQSGDGPPTSPGDYSQEQRDAFRRPLSDQEQQMFSLLEAATTGRTTPGADQQARIQALINADLANGVVRPVSDYVAQVNEAATSSPGSSLYSAARGEIPDEMAQGIREQVLMSMGNIGARFGSDTSSALGGSLARAGQERMMQAQPIIAQLQTQAALIDAQREQQAQQALYQDYLRNAPITERENLQLLMQLLGLNVGTSGTFSNTTGGGTDAAIAAAIQGGGALAGAVIPALGNYFGNNTYQNSLNTTPTILPPGY